MLNPTIQRRSTIRRVCRSRGQVVRGIRCSGYAGPLHLEAVHSSISLRVPGSRNERARGSIMSAKFRIRRPLHVRCLFNKLLTLIRTFRRAHSGDLRADEFTDSQACPHGDEDHRGVRFGSQLEQIVELLGRDGRLRLLSVCLREPRPKTGTPTHHIS